MQASLARGERLAGDLIPWTVSQQYQDPEFAALSGGRVVRIATHPNYMRVRMGGVGGSTAGQWVWSCREGEGIPTAHSARYAPREEHAPACPFSACLRGVVCMVLACDDALTFFPPSSARFWLVQTHPPHSRRPLSTR